MCDLNRPATSWAEAPLPFDLDDTALVRLYESEIDQRTAAAPDRGGAS